MRTDHPSAQIFPALAAGLCQDSGIYLHVGDHWSFDPQRRIIEVDKKHLEEEPDLALGLLAHEVSHVWISRYHLFSPGELSRPIWSSFMNALEDPRVNLWIQRRYPGTAPWFQTMYTFDRKAPINTPSRFLMWGAAVSVADAYDWTEFPPWIEDHALVQEAFTRTIAARRRYALQLPPANVAGCQSDKRLAAAIANEVVPHLNHDVSIRWIDRAEKLVMLSAARARALAVAEILPIVRTLIEQDEQSIASFFGQHPEFAELVDLGLRQNRSEVLDIVGEALGTPADPRTEHETKLARRAFAQYIARKGSPSRFSHDAPADAVEAKNRLDEKRLIRRRRGRAKPHLDPGAISSAVQRQLPTLVRDMESVLEPRKQRRLRPGFATGQHLDLRRAMAFEANKRDYDRLWRQRSRPSRPKASVSLLVDLSGSMQGSKIEVATIGTLLLAETLERLEPRVSYAVAGFQDELIPFKDFSERLSSVGRNAILEMPLEAHGDRPGGRNQPRYNDDGPCLAEAAEKLTREPGQRILFVVSDGRPAGRRSGENELREVIERLSNRAVPLTLFGLGLGPETDHVTEFYPNALANIPVSEFAVRIGGLLKRVLGEPVGRRRF